MARKIVPQRVEEVKKKIIQSSIELIIRNGFCQFTLKSVAQRLGISKAAIYWYFPTKEELIKELSRDVRNKYIGSLQEISSASLSPKQKLTSILARFESVEDELTCILPIKIFLECYTEKNDIQELIRQSYIEFTNIIENILREGVDKGEFVIPGSTDAVAEFIVGAIDGITLHGLITGKGGNSTSNIFIMRALEFLMTDKQGGEPFHE